MSIKTLYYIVPQLKNHPQAPKCFSSKTLFRHSGFEPPHSLLNIVALSHSATALFHVFCSFPPPLYTPPTKPGFGKGFGSHFCPNRRNPFPNPPPNPFPNPRRAGMTEGVVEPNPIIHFVPDAQTVVWHDSLCIRSDMDASRSTKVENKDQFAKHNPYIPGSNRHAATV